MAEKFDVPELPFQLSASHAGVWQHRERGGVVATAPAHTDFYLNPGGVDAADAESMLNAATLLGMPPAGDFQFGARVTVDFRRVYASLIEQWLGTPAADVIPNAGAFGRVQLVR